MGQQKSKDGSNGTDKTSRIEWNWIPAFSSGIPTKP